MAASERLYELWLLYYAQKDLGYLQQWLKAFVGAFEKSISLSSLEPRRPEEAGAEVPLLPLDALHLLAEQLDQDDLEQALLLLKLFIILCRNLENVEAGWGQILVPRVLALLTGLMTELKGSPSQEGHGTQLENVALHALLLCEGLFDPYQTWRRQHSGEVISSQEKSKYKFPPAALPGEFGAFFQESLQDADRLPPTLLWRLVHLFGAVLAGGKENGQLAVSAGSVQGLLGVVRGWGCGPAQDLSQVLLALKVLVGAVHVLHASRAPPRGPELRTLLEGYFHILNADWPASSSSGSQEALVTLWVSMLDAIPMMLACEDRPVLQATFLSNNCFEHLIRLIQNSKVLDQDTDAIAVHVVRVLTCIMSDSPSAKEVFKERIGYQHLQEVLQSHGPPTHRLLQELLNMAVEGDHSTNPPPPVRNEQPVLVLVQWLPSLPTAELRLFLAQRLWWLCDSCPASRATCVQAGLVGYLLETLGTGIALGARCQEQLLALLQALGRVSLRPLELRRLLRPPPGLDSESGGTESQEEKARHAGAIIRALSGMARHQGPARALCYFDLTPSMAGIMVPPVQRWPGPGFTFHAWLCLHSTETAPTSAPSRPLQRKQLYSLFTSNGSGFEAFFTEAGTLVVAVCTRKEYITVSLPEVSFADSAWHCVAIVHVPGRRPFSQNLVNVFKDGHLVKTAPLRFPSLSEPFSSCCIGSAGHRTTTTTTGLPTALSHTHPSLTRSQSVPASAGLSWGSGLGAPLQEGSISSTLAGTQDTRWGSPTSLEGELGTVAIFHEALQAPALRALCVLGPNEPAPFKPEGELQELGAKLLLHYSPQACKNNICLDLSPGHGLDGRLTGHRVETWDVKDVVNCVGGMGALLPLLEQVAVQPQEAEAGPGETHDLVGPELTSGHNSQGLLLPLGKSSEERMERNAVAAFLLMLRNFLQGHPVNQESLVQCQGPAIIGALLRKVPSWAMDMNVLMSAQLLMEQVAADSSGPLLYLLYQHLLFNFHLWALSDFAVRLGHIQYMSSIVREHRQKLRKKYGVQFILDALRTHYSPQRERPLAADDLRTVQTSLLGLAREFLVRSFSVDDMQVVLSFLAATSDDGQVVGTLDLLLALLQGSPAQEPLAIFLLEPGNLEVLLTLLVRPRSPPLLTDRVCKILRRLQQNERLPERNRQRLRLRDCGLQGLVASLPEGTISPQLCQGLYKLFVGAAPQLASPDCLSLSDLLALVQLSLQADLSVRLDICRQLFHLIYGQPEVVRLLARQAGWQNVLTRLYVLEAAIASGPPCFLPELPTSLEPALPPPPTELPAESSEVFLPSGFPCPDPDAFYHALSPFSTPFDLGLERASVGSGSAAGGGSSGTLTPASQPGTPSPLDGPRPFPTAQGRHSSSLSNVLEDGSLLEPTISGDDTSNTSNPQQTPEEELCNLLTNVLFSVTWRGVEGSDEAAWRERGQVFSVLTQLGASATLVRPPDYIKRSLLEMMLESALTDIKEAPPGSLANLTQQALWLLRLLQDFLCAEGHGNQELWSEKLFEGVCNLLDRLGAWPHLANSIPALCEMAQIGLRLVLGYILLEDPQLHAQAYVKLHTLLQTAVPARREEACYVLSKLEAALSRALNTSSSETEHAQSPSPAVAASERCSWLVPLVRTLLDRAYGPLGLQWGLPSLPPTNGSPTFFEDFQAFCGTPEWRHFIDKQVQPTMSKFEMDTYAKSHDLMSGFWNACYDMLMSSGQRHQRERIQSGRAFQELVLEPAQRRARLEGLRYAAVLKQQAAQHSTALLHWGALWRQLSSPCGAWARRVPPATHWKLSSAETYSRMRLKLVPNHHFDPHLEASALRDNLGEAPMTPSEEASLPLAVTKEAKISAPPEELLEDEFGEDEMAVLETLMEAAELDEQREKLVLSAECQLVTVVAVVPGLLEVTTQHVYFYDGSMERVETEEGIGHDFRRPLAQLREVHLRRFNLRRSALELFFIDQSNYFLNFPCKVSGSSASSPCQAPRPQPYPVSPHTQVRNQVYSWLLRLRPHTQGYLSSRSPQEMLRASGLTQKWVQREISNFEYLMQLNTIAGRTYNDLSQYPVFPWVLQDYVSPVLDLSNPAVFRDLSKPIGVVNPKHAQLVREKYESFEDPAGTIDKFHYGTHYSNAAGVMHYLIRVEPFTSLHVQLQSGRFDCSDRQFHSVAAAWQARLESPADVKELIPEFFYFPDFLENQNGFDLGCLQLTNEKVDDVVLPPWASCPEDFIQQHRRALESEYVSTHLHEWIDLIFGYKQRGPAAEEALNVFYYCTYEGAVDLDHVADERERKALEGIISNFGQTPCQLLKEPHPPRLSAEEAANRLARLDTNSPSIFQNLDQLKAFFAEVVSEGVPLVLALVPHRQSHSFITQSSSDLLVTVSASGLLGTHSWLPYDRNINNYFTFSKDPSISNPKVQKLLSGPWVPGSGMSGQALAVAPDGKLLFSGGHWDGSLRVTGLPRGKLLSQLSRHLDVVTCLALDTCGIYLISGSRDTTCMVWRLLQQGGFSVGLAPKPVQVLYGHEAAVSCVAISTELDMAVSGSEDGTVIIHTVRRGQFVAALRPPGATLPGPVSHLALGSEGQIVVQSSACERPGAQVTYSLHLYSVNGRLRASLPLAEQPTALTVAGDFVLLGTIQCSLHILHLNTLRPAVSPLPMKVPVRSVSVTKERSHVLVGLEDGKLIVVGAGQPSEVRSSQFARKLWRSSRRISQVSSGETEYNPGEAR
ncbi:neurobeachin-like protein 2 isoform X2 [Phodopus roborovskii]|uniref:Neurobeachin-like protein 2 n=1 Tax=Phodopus roborovskii TaxID=109678 RepID=A0AAU9YR27_PHORO|nr:neurobeachin-like protein 2 isoform X2 [Phodopus roborovskii]CAH6777630.1 Nbeal2 [Phodopus roborovskii]